MTPVEEWRLDTLRLGRRVVVFDCLDSTNSHAAALANDPANDGLVVVAREQTAGRGQHGRSWQCPAGAGVLLSVLLFPPPVLRRPAVLTAWAAVSVCETIRQVCDLQARVKWPNDVLIRGRKVCGILIETRMAEGHFAVVAGIGLNVNQGAEAFGAPELSNGTSLALSSGKSQDCADVTRRLIAQLDEEYDRLCGGDLATLESCWKWRVGLLGRPVVVESAGATHRGRLCELGWDGVVLGFADGSTLNLAPEIVRHVHPA
jgi:BirA family biotin operon repressor/biotin-[acetyl-CoA-carboxylase] ligase